MNSTVNNDEKWISTTLFLDLLFFFTFVIFSSTMTVDNSEGLYIFITTVWMQWECILEVSRIFFKQ